MSISADKKTLKTAIVYLFASLFTALFGAVYEIFSHGVYSYFMIYAFAIPLVLGTLVYLAAAFLGKGAPGEKAQLFYHPCVTALTVGCILKGVLDIYGTTSRLLIIYSIGAVFLLIICFIVSGFERRKRKDPEDAGSRGKQ